MGVADVKVGSGRSGDATDALLAEAEVVVVLPHGVTATYEGIDPPTGMPPCVAPPLAPGAGLPDDLGDAAPVVVASSSGAESLFRIWKGGWAAGTRWGGKPRAVRVLATSVAKAVRAEATADGASAA
jgi:hypothetical protein